MKYELFIFKTIGNTEPQFKKISGDYKGLTKLMDILLNHSVLICIKNDIRVLRVK